MKKFSRDTATSPDVWALQLATSTPLGSGTLLTSVAMLKNESVSHADAVSYGIRYDYPLSQRTKVYVGLAGVRNGCFSPLLTITFGPPSVVKSVSGVVLAMFLQLPTLGFSFLQKTKNLTVLTMRFFSMIYFSVSSSPFEEEEFVSD